MLPYEWLRGPTLDGVSFQSHVQIDTPSRLQALRRPRPSLARKGLMSTCSSILFTVRELCRRSVAGMPRYGGSACGCSSRIAIHVPEAALLPNTSMYARTQKCLLRVCKSACHDHGGRGREYTEEREGTEHSMCCEGEGRQAPPPHSTPRYLGGFDH